MAKEKLSNLYDIGSSKRVFQSEWREEGIPFYRAREIARLSEDGYVDNELFIDEELYEEYTEKYGKPQPGDVMVTGVGTLGVCYIVKPEDKFYFKDGNILWFRQKAPERILPEYLVKAFDSKEVKDFISKNSSGTTVGTFTIQNANKMEISLPALDQQKEIIERISKLEGIIKKRQHELEMLDELIKARFVELFGDIKTNEHGWKKCTFKDVSTKITDGEHGTVPRVDEGEGYLYFMARNITKDGEINLSETSFVPQEIHEKIYKRCNPEKDDLLLVCVGATIGKCTLVPETMGEFSMARSVALIKPNKEMVTSNFLINVLRSESIQNDIDHCSHAAAQAGLYTNMINSLEAFVPPMNLQIEFDSFCEQVDKSKVEVQKALEKTQLLFDSLMQEYFG